MAIAALARTAVVPVAFLCGASKVHPRHKARARAVLDPHERCGRAAKGTASVFRIGRRGGRSGTIFGRIRCWGSPVDGVPVRRGEAAARP